MNRRTFAATLAATALLGLPLGAAAQAYPNKSVRMIIPFPPGGTLDFVGRLLAQKLSDQTGQQFVVENRPGGNNMIGSAAVAAAPPDGYTLLFNASTFTTTPMTVKASQYDVLKDFTPIALVASNVNVLVVRAESNIKSVQDLLATAKANPDKLFAGNAGGTSGGSADLLNLMAGIKTTVVTYKGAPEAQTDLLGGRIDFMFTAMSTATPLV